MLASSLGFGYTGSMSRTVSGRTCQAWSAQFPHKHGYTDDRFFPDDTIKGASNHCRNPAPGNLAGLWCFTTDRMKRWERCDIPACSGEYSSDKLLQWFWVGLVCTKSSQMKSKIVYCSDQKEDEPRFHLPRKTNPQTHKLWDIRQPSIMDQSIPHWQKPISSGRHKHISSMPCHQWRPARQRPRANFVQRFYQRFSRPVWPLVM